MRRLPPLNALRVFEVAARTGSYAEAGTELGLTHGAVSRQIAGLEAWLGQRLFVRSGRRMVATPAARAFAAEVSLSFDRTLVDATRDEAVKRDLGTLELSVRIELNENHAAFARMGFMKTLEVAHPGYDRPTSLTMRAPVRR